MQKKYYTVLVGTAFMVFQTMIPHKELEAVRHEHLLGETFFKPFLNT